MLRTKILNIRPLVATLWRQFPHETDFSTKPSKPPIDTFRYWPTSVKFYAVLHRTTLTWKEVNEWIRLKQMDDLRACQRYQAKRHQILGPDLATAHFITVRNGKVKFKNNDKWMTKDNIKTGEIPSKFVSGLFVEAVDASATEICYEGFENLVDLKFLKRLMLKDCPHVDDFCLNRLHLVADTLEFLDISGCLKVTANGLCTLHKLKHMKELVIYNTPKIAHKELACLMLQDVLPQCEIQGVDYDDPALFRRLRNYLEEVEDKKEEKFISSVG